MQPIELSLADKNHPLYKTLESLGVPGNKTEQYRHFAIKPILARRYSLLIPSHVTPKQGSKLIIKDGIVTEFPKGVHVSINNNFQADITHYDALYFLSHILNPAVISLQIDEDIDFEIQHHFTCEQTLLLYRIAIKSANNIQVEIFETFNMKNSNNSLLIYGVDADIGEHTTLRWIRDEKSFYNQSNVIGTHHFNTKHHGAFELKTFDFGSATVLHLYKIDLDNYAWTDAMHLLLATKEARLGNVLFINHNQPYAKSVQDARSILKDKSLGIFDGKIKVAHGAKYASANQHSKAILLGENSHMYTKPQLEIYTDELEASHGSTIGQLNEDALFYLRSRGISQEDARKMLVLAFADTLIRTIKSDKITKRIHKDFEDTYYTT